MDDRVDDQVVGLDQRHERTRGGFATSVWGRISRRGAFQGQTWAGQRQRHETQGRGGSARGRGGVAERASSRGTSVLQASAGVLTTQRLGARGKAFQHFLTPATPYPFAASLSRLCFNPPSVTVLFCHPFLRFRCSVFSVPIWAPLGQVSILMLVF